MSDHSDEDSNGNDRISSLLKKTAAIRERLKDVRGRVETLDRDIPESPQGARRKNLRQSDRTHNRSSGADRRKALRQQEKLRASTGGRLQRRDDSSSTNSSSSSSRSSSSSSNPSSNSRSSRSSQRQKQPGGATRSRQQLARLQSVNQMPGVRSYTLPYCILIRIIDILWGIRAKPLFGSDILSLAMSCQGHAEALRVYRRDRTRTKVFFELVSTERSYIDALDAGIARSTGHPQLAAFTAQLTMISKINSVLYVSLRKRMQDWTAESGVADIFLRFGQSLKLYNTYSAAHDDGTKIAENLLAKKKLTESEFHWICSAGIAPIQRVPRYMLLLREMLKKTPDDHIDKVPLEKAMELVNLVAKGLEGAVLWDKQAKQVDMLLNDVEGLASLAQNSTLTLVTSGVISMRDPKKKKRSKEVLVVLFEQFFVIAMRKKPWKCWLSHRVSRNLRADHSVDGECRFDVFHEEDEYEFTAPDAEICEKWVGLIKKTVEKVCQQKKSLLRGK